MDRSERFYRMTHLLKARRVVELSSFLKDLGVSPATFKRDLEYLRSRMNVPIEWDRDAQAYRLNPGQQWQELAGVWLSSSEILALLTLQNVLGTLDPGGILQEHIAPLEKRLHAMLGSAGHADQIRHRVRVVELAQRPVSPQHFKTVGAALVQRKRLSIRYANRGAGQATQRVISPQRLTHYRDNWYVDAWCHLRDHLRSFSVDAIEDATPLEDAAIDLPLSRLDAELGAGYGIFSGQDIQWAHLRFNPERARWVAHECWHPQQRGSWDAQGHWLLELPYSDPRELVRDVMRHVPGVEVIQPLALREMVRQRLVEGLEAFAA